MWSGQVSFADVTSPPSDRPNAPASSAGWRVSPRVLALAVSVMWRHVTEDPVRALLLGWRVLPGRVRPWLRYAGPYGRATVAWGSGDRKEALALLDTTPQRLAAFALAVDRPDAARRALDRMPTGDPARALLLARLAAREGRLAPPWPRWTACPAASRPRSAGPWPVSCTCWRRASRGRTG